MVWERDRLLGVRPADRGGEGSPRFIAAAFLVAALVVAFLAGRMTAPDARGVAPEAAAPRDAPGGGTRQSVPETDADVATPKPQPSGGKP